MTNKEFWRIIDQARQASAPGFSTIDSELISLLNELSSSEFGEFRKTAFEFYNQAYDWNLWAAAYVLMGGCSDDSFMDFRQALVGLGKVRYENAVADPDSLADLDEDEIDFLYQEMFFNFFGEVQNESEIPLPGHPGDPIGEAWEGEGIQKRYPRLKARFWDSEPEGDEASASNEEKSFSQEARDKMAEALRKRWNSIKSKK